MPDDIAGQWKALTSEQREQALSRMSAQQKLQLAGSLGYKAPAVTATPGESPSAISRFGSSAVAPIAGAAKGLVTAVGASPSPEEAGVAAVGGQGAVIAKRLLLDPQIEQGRQALDRSLSVPERIGHGLAAITPVVGPWAAQFAETEGKQVGSGDYAGAAGTLAGNAALYFAPKAAGKFVGAGAKALRATEETARRGAQSAFGAGERTIKSRVADEAKSAADERTAIADKNKKADEATHAERGAVDERNRAEQEKYQKEVESHRQATEVVDAENRAKIDKYTDDKAEADARREEYESAKAEAERLKAAEQERETAHGKLAKQVLQQSQRMVERIKQVHAKWKDSSALQKAKDYQPTGILDKGFAQIRQATAGLGGSSEALRGAVTNALDKISGSTENVKIFKDILSKNPDSDPEFVSLESPGGGKTPIPKGHPLYDVLREGQAEGKAPTWKDLQGYYTETGSALSKGNLPADVYQALKSLHEDIGAQMQIMAKQGGVGAKWNLLKAQYADYMQTFRELAGPNHSGSPIAQSLVAEDPAYAIKPLMSEETAQRVRNSLARFDPATNGQGGAAALYDNLRKTHSAFDVASNPIKVPPTPKEPSKGPAYPALKPNPAAPGTPIVSEYSEPHATTPVESREVDTRAMRDQMVTQKLKDWTSISRYQVARLVAGPVGTVLAVMTGHPGFGIAGAAYTLGEMTPFIAQRLLDNPGFREWVTRPPEAELADLKKLPNADKLIITDGLKKVAAQAQKRGVTVDPKVFSALTITGRNFTGNRTAELKRLRDAGAYTDRNATRQ